MNDIIGLIRHGRTTWNLQGRVQGQVDTDLTDEGRLQAKLLGIRLHREKWDLIISSDLRRARETAEIVAGFSRIPLVDYDPRLRERNFGQIEGTTEAERVTRFGANWRELDLDMESSDQMHERWLHFAVDLSNKYGEGFKILIVSHGNYIVELLKKYQLEREEYLQNTSLTVLEKANPGWKMNVYNSLWHLS
jgi:probable phosphoglycerate mutase